MRLILYQRDDCHLCDLAIDSIFVDADAALEARYGERVPVLRDDESARELNWPFDVAAVSAWLAA